MGADPEDDVVEKLCSCAVKACFRLVKGDALNVPTGQSFQKLDICDNVLAPDNETCLDDRERLGKGDPPCPRKYVFPWPPTITVSPVIGA